MSQKKNNHSKWKTCWVRSILPEKQHFPLLQASPLYGPWFLQVTLDPPFNDFSKIPTPSISKRWLDHSVDFWNFQSILIFSVKIAILIYDTTGSFYRKKIVTLIFKANLKKIKLHYLWSLQKTYGWYYTIALKVIEVKLGDIP